MNRLFFIVACCSAICARTVFSETPEAPAPTEIQTLRDEFAKKRADAVKPSVEWYKQQLAQNALSATGPKDLKTTKAIESEVKALDRLSIGTDVEKVPSFIVTLRGEFMRRLDTALEPVFRDHLQQLDKLAREAAAHHQAELALACQRERADLPAPGPGCASLIVMKAMYGSGDKRVDVKKSLVSHIDNHRLRVTAPWKFPDPLPGTPKDLQVTYRFIGEVHTQTFGERQEFSLP